MRKLVRGGQPEARRPRRSSLMPYVALLERRWAEGCRNGAQLWRETREAGFRGGQRVVTERVDRQCPGHRNQSARGIDARRSVPPAAGPAADRRSGGLDIRRATLPQATVRSSAWRSPFQPKNSRFNGRIRDRLRKSTLPVAVDWHPSCIDAFRRFPLAEPKPACRLLLAESFVSVMP